MGGPTSCVLVRISTSCPIATRSAMVTGAEASMKHPRLSQHHRPMRTVLAGCFDPVTVIRPNTTVPRPMWSPPRRSIAARARLPTNGGSRPLITSASVQPGSDLAELLVQNRHNRPITSRDVPNAGKRTLCVA